MTDFKILYIEDNEGLIELIRQTLDLNTDHFFYALDGASGLRILENNIANIDIVLTDYSMPVMTGLDVLHKIMDMDNAPPVIMVTGAGDEQIAVDALKHGASDYIIKDVNLNYLQMLPSVISQVIQERIMKEAYKNLQQESQIEKLRADLLALFIQDASHEFRTPITIIKTATYILNKLIADAKQLEYVNQISTQIDDISTLIEQLIFMVRIDNSLTLSMSDINIINTVKQVVESARIQHNSNIYIGVSNISDVLLYGDQEYLNIALMEVIKNACQYSNDYVNVKLYQYDKYAVIEVVDRGIGIQEHDMKYVFDRFYRGDNIGSIRGFGLGLPIAKQLFEMHGGTIQINSIPSVETTIRIVLPLK